MKARKYYGVYAKNGLMVANNWDKVQNESQYCISEHYKRFDTWQDAYYYAVSGYNTLHPETPFFGVIEKTNWWYHTKELFSLTKSIPMVIFNNSPMA